MVDPQHEIDYDSLHGASGTYLMENKWLSSGPLGLFNFFGQNAYEFFWQRNAQELNARELMVK